MINTLDYYNQNADDFIKGTISVDFVATQDRFIKAGIREGKRAGADPGEAGCIFSRLRPAISCCAC